MNKLYVTFEIAKILKAMPQFDEPCIVCYEESEDNKFELSNYVNQTGIVTGVECELAAENCFPAPTYQQVVDWLIEKHEIEVNVKSWKGEGDGIIVWIFSVKKLGMPSTYRFDTKSFNRTEAWIKALTHALEKIK